MGLSFVAFYSKIHFSPEETFFGFGWGGGLAWGGGGPPDHPPPPPRTPPPLSDWANFAPGLQPIKKIFWHLQRKSVYAKKFVWRLQRL